MRELYQQSGGLDLSQLEYYEELKAKKGDEWKSFLSFCDNTVNNKYFHLLLEKIKAEQLKYTFDNAGSLEEFNFGRCISIAIDRVYSEFKDKSVEYQTLINNK